MEHEQMIKESFGNAVKGDELTEKVNRILESEGFNPENTLFGNSTCPDELNRFVTNFGDYWGENFPLGGLAGFPFTSKTGFSAYSHHIPKDGNLFILYASHVGVDSKGNVGTVVRHNKGMTEETSSCGSAVGAYNALKQNPSLKPDFDGDRQQAEVIEMVREEMDRIEAGNAMVELPNVMYEKIHQEIMRIIPEEFSSNIALLGGIQINTPHVSQDYFVVKNFEIIRPGDDYRKDLRDEL